jgi:hypothetical protein
VDSSGYRDREHYGGEGQHHVVLALALGIGVRGRSAKRQAARRRVSSGLDSRSGPDLATNNPCLPHPTSGGDSVAPRLREAGKLAQNSTLLSFRAMATGAHKNFGEHLRWRPVACTGSADTELGVLMEPEVGQGAACVPIACPPPANGDEAESQHTENIGGPGRTRTCDNTVMSGAF